MKMKKRIEDFILISPIILMLLYFIFLFFYSLFYCFGTIFVPTEYFVRIIKVCKLWAGAGAFLVFLIYPLFIWTEEGIAWRGILDMIVKRFM